MNEIAFSPCPSCGMQIEPLFNFCPQCGKSLQELFHGVGISKQIYIYLVSIILPPFGLAWTFRYSKYPLLQTKIVGIIALILTLASFGVTLYIFFQLLHQVQSSFSNFDSLYNSMGL